MSSNYAFDRDDMIEAIERMFEREVGRDHGMFDVFREEDTAGGKGNVDVVYIAGDRHSLHSIRIEQSFDNCLFDVTGGIHSLSDVEANYVWIALPLDEFRDGDEEYNGIMRRTCEERGIGIITVQPKGRGVSAKIIVEADEKEGDHLSKYGELERRWREETKDVLVGDDYKVVNYYSK
ncbi:MAG: hypothetical protein ACOCV2_10030 [Persicimonas sp.]